MTHYGSFEFELLPPLVDQLVTFINTLHSAPLIPANLTGIDANAQGVYLLYHNGTLVYIGKTDAESGLRRRLERHCRNIMHRVGLTPDNVTFKAVRVAVFTAMDIETALIRRDDLGPHPWNGSGFGANDPGRERDTTKVTPGNFDFDFPIDVDVCLAPMEQPPPPTAVDVLNHLRNQLPYTFRVERPHNRFHPDLLGANVTLPRRAATTRHYISAVIGALPPGWQFTRLAGRLILYKESRAYPSAVEIWRSPGSKGSAHENLR